MIELELYGATTVPTLTLIPSPNKHLDVIRYGTTSRLTRLGSHRNSRDRVIDLPSRPLLARDQKGVYLVRRQSVIIPVEFALELPVSSITDPDYAPWLLILKRKICLVFVLQHFLAPLVRIATDLHPQPAFARKKDGLEAETDVVGSAQHLLSPGQVTRRWGLGYSL